MAIWKTYNFNPGWYWLGDPYHVDVQVKPHELSDKGKACFISTVENICYLHEGGFDNVFVECKQFKLPLKSQWVGITPSKYIDETKTACSLGRFVEFKNTINVTVEECDDDIGWQIVIHDANTRKTIFVITFYNADDENDKEEESEEESPLTLHEVYEEIDKKIEKFASDTRQELAELFSRVKKRRANKSGKPPSKRNRN